MRLIWFFHCWRWINCRETKGRRVGERRKKKWKSRNGKRWVLCVRFTGNRTILSTLPSPKEVLVWFLFVSLLAFSCLFISFRFTSFGLFVFVVPLFLLFFWSLQRTSPEKSSFSFFSFHYLSFHFVSLDFFLRLFALFVFLALRLVWFHLPFRLVSSLYLRNRTVLNTNSRSQVIKRSVVETTFGSLCSSIFLSPSSTFVESTSVVDAIVYDIYPIFSVGTRVFSHAAGGVWEVLQRADRSTPRTDVQPRNAVPAG